MPDVVTSPYAKLTASIAGVLSASQAIRDGIADHAQKHEAELEKSRTAAQHAEMINDGIARQSS
jgi:hypothetical protein